MKGMEKLRMMLCDEIDQISERGISLTNIETIYKIVDIIKDIDTIMAMQGEYPEKAESRMMMLDDEDVLMDRLNEMLEGNKLTIDEKSALTKAMDSMKR